MLAAAATLVLAACAGARSQSGESLRVTARVEPPDVSFSQVLSENYLALANAEIRTNDWQDSDHFAAKALRAARDQRVGPDPVDRTQLDPGQAEELSKARWDLLVLLDQGAQSAAPRQAATAQSSFDCWLRDAMGDGERRAFEACREAYYRAHFRVQLALGVPVTGAPSADFTHSGNSYQVIFDTDSAKLSATALATIDAIAASLKASDSAKVVLIGRIAPGSPGADEADLTARRILAVKNFLLSAGVKARQITETARGKTATQAPTTEEPAWRRRIEIKLFE